ncbi:MAG TPA: hypothetical protein VKR58_14515, partial [Aquella sp.]|nr:hypothetical protein [Aquella sp.]
MGHIDVAGQHGRILAIDFVGPFPRTVRKNSYLITGLDLGTKMCYAKPVPDMTARTAAKFILEVCLAHDFYESLLSDRAQSFLSDIVKEINALLNVNRLLTTAYHPQTSNVECLNKSLVQNLAKSLDQTNLAWDLLTPWAVYTENAKYHDSLKMSPIEATYNHFPRNPGIIPSITPNQKLNVDVVNDTRRGVKFLKEQIQNNLQKAFQKQKLYYDKKRLVVQYEIGDKVLLFDHRIPAAASKLLPFYFDKIYTVVEKKSPLNYLIKYKDELKVVHVSSLRRYYPRVTDQIGTSVDSEASSIPKSSSDEGLDSDDSSSDEDVIYQRTAPPVVTEQQSPVGTDPPTPLRGSTPREN